MEGFSNEVKTFPVKNPEELLDIKLAPNPVDISWISFENLVVAQIGTTDEANASGTLVIKVPLAQQDWVKQIFSTMVIEKTNSTSDDSMKISVTPPINLPVASLVDEEYVHYRIDFAANNFSLETGSNLFKVTITVGDKNKEVEIGNVNYDSCVDINKMCLKLTWSDGSDPDLHSIYWPDWDYAETLGSGLAFDNKNHVYGYPTYQKWLLTGDKVHLKDATDDIPAINDSSNRSEFTINGAENILILKDAKLNSDSISISTPVFLTSTGNLPGGLLVNTIYYLHSIDAKNKTVGLASNTFNAIQGNSLELTNDAGDGVHTLTTLGTEIQVWATNNRTVGDGTYLVWVEDASGLDLQGVRVELSGPGVGQPIIYGPFSFKQVNDGVPKAPNNNPPYQQPVFLIQVQSGDIKRSDQIPIGSTLEDWNKNLSDNIGELPSSIY